MYVRMYDMKRVCDAEVFKKILFWKLFNQGYMTRVIFLHMIIRKVLKRLSKEKVQLVPNENTYKTSK